jgi:hypothetical protein
MTADVLRTPRRGTPSSTRNQRTCTRCQHEKPCRRSGDASFTRSEDPCTSILTTHRAKARWWGADETSRLGKLAQAGGTNTGVVVSGRSAARRVSIAPAREAAWHVRKGRRSRPPSLRGSRARVWLLARRMYVAEVGRRRLVSNKLGKRAPKRAAGSSEQGPSSSRLTAGETAGGSRKAKRRSRKPDSL